MPKRLQGRTAKRQAMEITRRAELTDIEIPKLLTTREAAEKLGMAPQTLTAWRCLGRYRLRFIRVGGRIRYRPADVVEFLQSRSVMPGQSPYPRPNRRSQKENIKNE
jgi:predicted site-specific integrase-resolvase